MIRFSSIGKGGGGGGAAFLPVGLLEGEGGFPAHTSKGPISKTKKIKFL
ncbi:hypothetical protein [Flavobacterium sp. 123]|jgi:hypothetical protein|nr:hypothetical protein [Flavobacterium sp. 123]